MTSWPVYKYALFSAGDAFLPPLMVCIYLVMRRLMTELTQKLQAVYSGLALLVQRIRWENWESQNKSEAGAKGTSLQPEEQEKADATLPVAAISNPDAKGIDSEVPLSDI